MARFTRGLVVTVAVVLLGLFITLVSQKPALGQNGQVQPVLVTNKTVPTTVTNTPLPATVSGTVAVSNLPATQNVNVTNTSLPVSGTVGVSSLPALTLNNANSNPLFTRDVDNPANEPFQAELCFGETAAGASTNACPLGNTQPSQFAVPTMTTDGKTVKALVIQFVDGGCTVTSPAATSLVQNVDLSLQNFLNVIPGDTGGILHLVPFTLNPMNTSPNTILQWATPMQAIAVANTEVQFFVGTLFGTECACAMNISGYLVTQ